MVLIFLLGSKLTSAEAKGKLKCTKYKTIELPKHVLISRSYVDGVKGVNRLATKGEKILLTTDKTRKKLTEIYRQPTK